MSLATVEESITVYFATNVETGLSLSTQYDNSDKDNPDTGDWCRMSILPGLSVNIEIGATRQRTVGIVMVQLFCDLDIGDGALMAIAVAIRVLFKNVSVGDARFYTPTINRVGRVKNNWQINVSCPFWFDETS